MLDVGCGITTLVLEQQKKNHLLLSLLSHEYTSYQILAFFKDKQINVCN